MDALMIVATLSVATLAISAVIVVVGSLLEPRHPAALELRARGEEAVRR